jgi:hypothetical protein
MRCSSGVKAAVSGALALGLAIAGAGSTAAEPGAIETLKLKSKRISEPSGLVASGTHEGVFWTHSDSGDEPRIFAIDRSGALLGEFPISGATHVDWEDIASDGKGHLYLADIGNNDSDRRDLVVYRVREPDPRSGPPALPVERALRFRYANQTIGKSPGNFDAEALVWFGGSLYLFTKERGNTKTSIYRLQDREGSEPQVIKPLGSLELGSPQMPLKVLARATAASLSGDGKRLALLTYSGIHLFERGGEEFLPLRPLRRIPLDPLEAQQAESIAWDGSALLFGNEQGQLFRIADPLTSTGAALPD